MKTGCKNLSLFLVEEEIKKEPSHSRNYKAPEVESTSEKYIRISHQTELKRRTKATKSMKNLVKKKQIKTMTSFFCTK
jgi:hypothetical protein